MRGWTRGRWRQGFRSVYIHYTNILVYICGSAISFIWLSPCLFVWWWGGGDGRWVSKSCRDVVCRGVEQAQAYEEAEREER